MYAIRSYYAKYFQEDEKSEGQFFDMIKDPYESTNIIENSEAKRKELAEIWNEWNSINKLGVWQQPGAYQNMRLDMYKQMHDEMQQKAAEHKPVIIE